MLRSWAEKAKRATVPGKRPTPWKKLRLLVSVSVHPARLRTRHYESPFANLSDPIQVGDFDRDQIAELARHHDLALDDSELDALMRLVGGHPYLARAVLWDLRDGRYSINDLLRGASLGCSLIADYLQRDQVRLDAAPDLGETLCELVGRPDAEVPAEPLDELIRLGLVKQGPNGSHPLRYPLFARLLEERAQNCERSQTGLQLVYCYAAADQGLRGRLETHLGLLQRDGYIASWQGHRIPSVGDGTSRAASSRELDIAPLDSADLILFVMSSDFLASWRAREHVAPRALARHEAGKAIVVPVVVHPCDWSQPPFERFTPLPRAGLPVSRWTDEDDAWADVAQAIRRIIKETQGHMPGHASVDMQADTQSETHGHTPGACSITLSRNGTGLCKILFLSANADPASPLGVDQEYRRVARRLEATRHRDRVELISWPDLRASDLPTRLRREQPTIVHFSGHGMADGGLVIRDRRGDTTTLHPAALAGFLGRRNDTVRLVILNACYSQSLADRLREHIDCVIGVGAEVTDQAAITFAETFYEALFDNEPIQSAIADSRDAVTAVGIPDGNAERVALHITTRAGVSPAAMRLFTSS